MSNDTPSTTTATPTDVTTHPETLPETLPAIAPRSHFGRRCRYAGSLAFVTKVYTEDELTDPATNRRLADKALGDMVDLLAFDANGSARPVKSVHIADSDWVE